MKDVHAHTHLPDQSNNSNSDYCLQYFNEKVPVSPRSLPLAPPTHSPSSLPPSPALTLFSLSILPLFFLSLSSLPPLSPHFSSPPPSPPPLPLTPPFLSHSQIHSRAAATTETHSTVNPPPYVSPLTDASSGAVTHSRFGSTIIGTDRCAKAEKRRRKTKTKKLTCKPGIKWWNPRAAWQRWTRG